MSTDVIAAKMEIVKKLKGQAIVLIDKKTAMWKISSDYTLIIDVTFPPELWAVKHDGKECGWKKSFEVPSVIKAQIDVFAGDYVAACEALAFGEADEEIDEDELKTSDEEETKIIEMERREKDAEASKIAQELENARKREENERILAEVANFEQEKHQIEEQSKKPEQSNTIYSQPDDVFETAPIPKKGAVKLLDIIYDLVEDDLVQFFGKTGTCKTSISIQAALEARASGKSVYYLDTEKNISRKKKTAMKEAGVIYMPYTPSNMTGEFKTVNDLIALHEFIKKIQKVDVLIIDSLGLPVLSVFCEGNQKDQGLSIQKMINISKYLKSYANKNQSLVIVINQPESDMNKDPKIERRSFGEKAEFYYKELLKTFFVEKKDTKTTVVVKTYRSRDYGQGYKLFTVEITDKGVKVIQ